MAGTGPCPTISEQHVQDETTRRVVTMADAKHDGKYISYEELDGGSVVRILLDRPDTRNAQNRGLLVELDEAFKRAEEDDNVRVVILGGVGPLFSSGHDMRSTQ